MPNFTFKKADGSKIDIEAKDRKAARLLATSKYGVEFKSKKAE